MEALTATQEAERRREENRKTWQWKVVEASRGSQSLIGSIIIAAMGKSHMVPSRKNIFTSLARVDREGMLHANFIDKYGVLKPQMPVIRTADLNDALLRLASQCQLTDDEATQFFTMVRQWIEIDERAKSVLN